MIVYAPYNPLRVPVDGIIVQAGYARLGLRARRVVFDLAKYAPESLLVFRVRSKNICLPMRCITSKEFDIHLVVLIGYERIRLSALQRKLIGNNK